MINKEQLSALLDSGVVVDESGSKVGKIGQIYLDDTTDEPEWVTASTGLFGTSETFIPIGDADTDGNELRVPYSKDKIKDAPRMDADGHLSPDQEQDLYRYYGLNGADTTPPQTDRSHEGDDRDQDRHEFAAAGHDTSGPDTDNSMTRSEEELRVGKKKVDTGKAKLRKYVTSENVSKTVPVQREVAEVRREPITAENRDQAMAGGELTDEEHGVTLSEEQVVVDKKTVPVERVTLGTETVTEQQEVSEDVRKEHIDTNLPDDQPRGN